MCFRVCKNCCWYPFERLMEIFEVCNRRKGVEKGAPATRDEQSGVGKEQTVRIVCHSVCRRSKVNAFTIVIISDHHSSIILSTNPAVTYSLPCQPLFIFVALLWVTHSISREINSSECMEIS